MNQREKTLGLLVAVLVAAFCFYTIYGKVSTAFEDKETALINAKNEFSDAEINRERMDRAHKKLKEWRSQSLPSNVRVARSEYKFWLQNKLEETGLEDSIITPGRATGKSSKASDSTIGMRVETNGSLKDLTKFLYAFYESNILHRISSLNITPESGGKNLQLSMNVEVMVLANAIEKDGIPAGTSKRLGEKGLKDYQDTIVNRNLFAVYVPPKPVYKAVKRDPPKPRKRTTPPPFDHATQAEMTGIVEENGKLVAWILERTTGKRHHLSAGDSFEIGLMKGTVKSVSHADGKMIIESEGKLYEIHLEDKLREGKLLSVKLAKQ